MQFVATQKNIKNVNVYFQYTIYIDSFMISIIYRAESRTESKYLKTSSISRTLVGNKIVDNSDVVGASPVGAAPTTSSFST